MDKKRIIIIAVIGLIVIVVGFLIYAALAKTKTTSIGGVTTETHGGIGAAILSFFTRI